MHTISPGKNETQVSRYRTYSNTTHSGVNKVCISPLALWATTVDREMAFQSYDMANRPAMRCGKHFSQRSLSSHGCS